MIDADDREPTALCCVAAALLVWLARGFGRASLGLIKLANFLTRDSD